MLNILIPMAGKSMFFESNEYPFPKPLIEINKRPMIELVLDNFKEINQEKKYIFIVKQEDCSKFHLDDTLNLLTDGFCEIVKMGGETRGAACSTLMAIEFINNNEELIISNGDQVIDVDFNSVLKSFTDRKADAAVICFESVHPKWSYVRLDEEQKVVETAEKRPLSKNAIAGFYFFKKGRYFVESAMKSIRKDVQIDNYYYIAPTLNEMILENKNIEIYKIDNSQYHSFYSPQKILEYEKEK